MKKELDEDEFVSNINSEGRVERIKSFRANISIVNIDGENVVSFQFSDAIVCKTKDLKRFNNYVSMLLDKKDIDKDDIELFLSKGLRFMLYKGEIYFEDEVDDEDINLYGNNSDFVQLEDDEVKVHNKVMN